MVLLFRLKTTTRKPNEHNKLLNIWVNSNWNLKIEVNASRSQEYITDANKNFDMIVTLTRVMNADVQDHQDINRVCKNNLWLFIGHRLEVIFHTENYACKIHPWVPDFSISSHPNFPTFQNTGWQVTSKGWRDPRIGNSRQKIKSQKSGGKSLKPQFFWAVGIFRIKR